MRRRFREAESGAMAIVVALVTCFVIVPLGALAVDIGMQRVARSDFQTVADTVALDMGRELASGQTPTASDAQQAAARAGGVVGGVQTITYNSQQVTIPTMAVYLGYVDPSGSTFISDQSLGCNGNAYNSYFTAPTEQHAANAVLVTATGKVNFNIVGGTGGACRSAIAAGGIRSACMWMDSYAAALNTGDSAILGPLGQMLGGNTIDTTVLSSSGILTANIKVLDFLNILKANLGVGSIDQVLNANVTAAQVVAAEVTALQPPYNTLSAAATALSQQIGVHIASSATFKVSDLVGITQGGSSALSAMVNPFDLAAASVQLANGTNAVAVSASSSNLTGLSASATVVSRPMHMCLGDAMKTMSQTSISATANINAPGSLTSAVGTLVNGLSGLLNGVLGALGSLLGGDTYDVPTVTLGPISATVNLASASGQITGLTCSGSTPTAMSILEGSSLAPATISIPIIISETRHYGGVLGIGRKSETVTSTLTTTISTVPQADQSVADTLSLPTNYDTAKAGPSGNLSVNNLSVSTVKTTDGSFSNGYPLMAQLLNSVSAVVNQVNTTVISQLESVIVTPLFNVLTTTLKNLLGVTIAGSSYRAERGSTMCNTPKLVG
jgi:uncharacterized membrane protein